MAKVLPEALPDPKYSHRGKTFAAPKLEAEVLTVVVMPHLMPLSYESPKLLKQVTGELLDTETGHEQCAP